MLIRLFFYCVLTVFQFQITQSFAQPSTKDIDLAKTIANTIKVIKQEEWRKHLEFYDLDEKPENIAVTGFPLPSMQEYRTELSINKSNIRYVLSCRDGHSDYDPALHAFGSLMDGSIFMLFTTFRESSPIMGHVYLASSWEHMLNNLARHELRIFINHLDLSDDHKNQLFSFFAMRPGSEMTRPSHYDRDRLTGEYITPHERLLSGYEPDYIEVAANSNWLSPLPPNLPDYVYSDEDDEYEGVERTYSTNPGSGSTELVEIFSRTLQERLHDFEPEPTWLQEPACSQCPHSAGCLYSLSF